MCGRYRLTAKERWLSAYFNLPEQDVHWVTRWNIAPTQQVATIRQDRNQPKRRFALMRWGLIPYWAKDASIAANTINAVSHTAAETPAFRDPLRRRRCLIPADGFYEWKQKGAKHKQPYSIGMADDSVFAFAGLWDRWTEASGRVIESCTILTTEANSLLREIHHRMPVILKSRDYDRWLDPAITDPQRVMDLLQPFDGQAMKTCPVSTAVNRVENDGPECAGPVVAPEQETLF
jgi:putative SOS response-associated peptidase YedK